MDNPLVILAMLAVGFYIAKLWWDDTRTAQGKGLPGAARSSRNAIVIAISGALAILAIETAGEKMLGLADQQSKMTWLFAAYSILAAPILEELVFRGYLVVNGKGKGALWGSIVAFSIGFALLHPFLWRWDDAGFALTLTQKGFFSVVVVFAMSHWLYAARFAPWNATQSLLPCFAAHAAKNAGVVVVKAASGYMSGWW